MGSTGAARGMRTSGNIPSLRFEASSLSLDELRMAVLENFDVVSGVSSPLYGSTPFTGYTNGRGVIMDILMLADGKYSVRIGTIEMGFTNQIEGLTERLAWEQIYNGLR